MVQMLNQGVLVDQVGSFISLIKTCVESGDQAIASPARMVRFD